jgi:predicted N-acetyltransferase YhbS
MNQAISVREATLTDNEAVAEVTRLATQALREIYRPKPGSAGPAPIGATTRLVAEMDGGVVGTVRLEA